MKEFVKDVIEGRTLDRARARKAMETLMDGGASPVQVAAFLAALRARGETLDELVGFAEVMRGRAVRVEVKREPLIDTCGTGGDGSGSYNISTAAALIAAGAGAAVAKHGNRSVSSLCGSADVLEALGVRAEIAPALVARCVSEAGVGFLFAPALHPGVKAVGPVRKELGARTVFNLLGPLSNPAGAKRQLLGVFSPGLVGLVARALKELGSTEALVVCSRDGLDELALSSPTLVAHLKNGDIREFEVEPESFGFPRYPREAFSGGDAAVNARILLSVLNGEPGPPLDIALLNAGAALMVAGLAPDIKSGVELARQAVGAKKALAALETLKRVSQGG